MEAGFKTNNNPFEDDLDLYSPDGGDSPPSSATFSDQKSSSCLSLKRSKRSMQKRVVSIPIKDLDQGSRLKGESAPPSDSWSWRKYGQKPIKGSPYPRGYYRCSSSKGCPARKQVERSRVDPTNLLVTYSCEHNHPWPASSSRNHHHHHTKIAVAATKTPPPTLEKLPIPPEPDTVENFSDLSEESLVIADEFGWFADMASTSSTSMLESPIFPETSYDMDADVAMFFPIKEEDESLFADLGELPECAVVFRRGFLGKEERAPWCGTT